MKIFITGIAGFIGSTLARRLLSEGHKVAGMDNFFTGRVENIPEGAKFYKGDISEQSSFAQVRGGEWDCIVHTAAQTSGEKSFEISRYDMESNINGSFNTYEFARSSKACGLVNFSSMSVYGNVNGSDPVNEDFRPEPVSLYGNSKLSAEQMLTLMSIRDNFPVVSFRLFNAYGPYQNLAELKQGMVSIYLAQFLRGEFEKVIVKGAFDRVRDFIYIDDIIDAVMGILSHPFKTGRFNLCSGKATSVGEVIDLIRTLSGIQKEVVQTGTTPGDIRGFAGSPELLANTIEWRPRTDIRSGLEKMINFYREIKLYE